MTPYPWKTLAGIPILDLPGRDFLFFYLLSLIAAVVWTLICRRQALRKFSVPGAELSELADPYDLAYLAGGPPRCTQVAVLRLVETGCVRWQSSTLFQSRLFASGPLPVERNDIEVALYSAIVAAGKKGLPVKDAGRAVSPRLPRIAARLAKLGLRPTDPERGGAGLLASLPLFALFLIGLIKVFIGIDREKPVILLGFLLLATLVTAFVLAKGVARLTSAGEFLLGRLRSPFNGMAAGGNAPQPAMPAPDLLLLSTGLALMGPAILPAYGHPLGMDKAFQQDLNAMGSPPSSGGCSSGCGGDGGGGDGGGCGGGCGGCGGD